MDVSKNSGTPKSSILIGFSIINHPFWGTPVFGNTQIIEDQLVGGWTNPFEKYARQIGSSPQVIVKNKNIWNHHLEPNIGIYEYD